MNHADRIVVDPAILVGKPCVKGTRLSVDFLLGLLAQGWSEAEVLRNYPGLTHKDVLACLEYASRVIGLSRSPRWGMQFLANENFPLDAVEVLRAARHDVALKESFHIRA